MAKAFGRRELLNHEFPAMKAGGKQNTHMKTKAKRPLNKARPVWKEWRDICENITSNKTGIRELRMGVEEAVNLRDGKINRLVVAVKHGTFRVYTKEGCFSISPDDMEYWIEEDADIWKEAALKILLKKENEEADNYETMCLQEELIGRFADKLARALERITALRKRCKSLKSLLSTKH
jgi:hypothetical protein